MLVHLRVVYLVEPIHDSGNELLVSEFFYDLGLYLRAIVVINLHSLSVELVSSLGLRLSLIIEVLLSPYRRLPPISCRLFSLLLDC